MALHRGLLLLAGAACRLRGHIGEVPTLLTLRCSHGGSAPCASNQRGGGVRAQTEEKKVRKKLQAGRYMTLETRKDGTKFTSRPLREAAERLQAIARSYDQRQSALVEQARCCAPHCPRTPDLAPTCKSCVLASARTALEESGGSVCRAGNKT